MNKFIGVLLLLVSASVLAMPMEAYEFDSAEQEQSFRKLNSELRCLVCQNQAIADSDAGLAKDLRTEIHTMLLEGKTEQQIIDFMVQRYGDYVLYNPPIKPLTIMLWFGPALIFLIALFYVIKFIRGQDDKGPEIELTNEENERLRNLQAGAETKDYDQTHVQKKQEDTK